MEFTEILFLMLMGSACVVFCITIYVKLSPNKLKRGRKMMEDGSFDTMKVEYDKLKSFYEEKVLTIERELKHWRGRAVKLEQIEDDNDDSINTRVPTRNLEEHYEIDVNSLSQILKNIKLPFQIDQSKIPELLQNPLIKAKAWEYIKKHREEAIQLGAIVPIGNAKSTPQNIESDTSEEDNGMMKIDTSDSKHMA